MAAYDITPLGSALEFDTSNATYKCIGKLSDTRFVVFWENSSTVKYIQTFEINTTTGVITANGSPLNISNASGSFTTPPLMIVLSSTEVVVYQAGQGYTVCTINSGTGAVTSLASSGGGAIFNSGVLMELNATYAYILLSYTGSGDDGFAIIHRITRSDGTLTEPSSAYEFDTTNGVESSLVKISSTKVAVFYRRTNISAIVLDVNTSTWAVSAAGSRTDTASGAVGSVCDAIEITSSLYVVGNAFSGTTDQGVNMSTFQIDTGTWAITEWGFGSGVGGGIAQQESNRRFLRIDDTHVILFYTGSGNDGYVRTLEMNPSTGILTNIDEVEFDTTNGQYIAAIQITDYVFICAWAGSDNDGYVRAFRIEQESAFIPQVIMF